MNAGTPEPISHRRIVVDQFGGPDRLRLATTTTSPRAGCARLKVLAIGTGFTDLMARNGEYLLQRKTPFSPGYQLVGEVVDCQADPKDPHADRLAPGTVVAACLTAMGAYAEYVSVPADLLTVVPEGLDPLVAAAMPLDYLTAVSLLDRHGRVKPGDAVLIHGATGGVGDALCQLGTLRGLTMYGTASQRSIARLKRYDVTPIDYRTQDVAAEVRRLRPEGLDAVFDHIGGKSLRPNFRLLAPGGVLVSYAFIGRPGRILRDTVGGAIHNMLLGLPPGRRTAVCSVTSEIKSDPGWARDNLGRLFDLALRGDVKPHVRAVCPLKDAAKAHVALESRDAVGKIILIP
ncbi:MAG: zinc-binding dehydrogenase [Stackebrandtia sp.]